MRNAGWLSLFAMAAVACGPTGRGVPRVLDGGSSDLSPLIVDFAGQKLPDFSMENPGPLDFSVARDFTVVVPGTGATGDPCTSANDCARSMAPGNAAATCLKSNMFGGAPVTWPGGYCMAPCRPSKNDVNGINQTDCPGDAPVCVGSGVSGTCYAGCTGFNDCRAQYVCANVTGTPTPACVPLAASECDPLNDPAPGGKKCPNGERCVSYSPDQTYGGCATICDPVAQGCPPPMMGDAGCVVDFQVNDGSGECIGVNSGNIEGGACIFLNDCPAGMQCYAQKCRNYCRTGGKACPNGQTCKDIVLAGIMVKFKANVTGICSP